MRTIIYALGLIISAGMFFGACEEIENALLEKVVEGKMLVVFDGGEEEILNCTFEQYGEGTGMSSEVFIYGSQASTTSEKYFDIMYGNYNNESALTTKTYSTSNEDDLLSVSTSYGIVGNDASVTCIFTEVTQTDIKGTFSGKVSTKSGLKTISGAFWSVQNQEESY